MGISSLFKGLDWSKMLGSVLGAGADMLTGHFNRKNQRAENQLDREFNASEAAKQREFQSKEAELAYDRQLDFYDTRQSPAAMMQQYKEAGVNPALMYGGSSPASIPSASAPSGASASSHSSSLPNMVGIGEQMISLAKSIEEMKLMRAEARNEESEAKLNEIDSLFREGVNHANIAQAWSVAGYNEELKKEVIQRVINNKDLTAAQVEELVQKALYHQAAADERSTQSAVNVENYYYTRTKRRESLANIVYILEQVKATKADIKIKQEIYVKTIQETLFLAARTSESYKNIELMSESIGLTKEQVNKLKSEVKLLEQKFTHDEIMNGFNEILKGIEAGEKTFYREDSVAGMLLHFIEALSGFIPGSHVDFTPNS